MLDLMLEQISLVYILSFKIKILKDYYSGLRLRHFPKLRPVASFTMASNGYEIGSFLLSTWIPLLAIA